jgi:hypothetical protein
VPIHIIAQWIALTFLLFRIGHRAETLPIRPVAIGLLLTFCYRIGSRVEAVAHAIFPFAEGILLAFLLGVRRWLRLGIRRNRIYVDDHSITVAGAGGKHIAMAAGCVGIIPDVIIARLYSPQIISYHKSARVDLVHGQRRINRHIKQLPSL